LNVEQSRNENRAFLDEIGGLETLSAGLGVRFDTGLSMEQSENLRMKYGSNAFPESPRKGFFELLWDALSDSTLMVLMAAAGVSLIIGILTEPGAGYIEGTAIFVAVFLVANITAFNDYTKELQFRALEQSSQYDERTSVLRNGFIQRINPADLVVGDIIVLQVIVASKDYCICASLLIICFLCIQAGDMAPADCIIVDNGTVLCNESSLTGEPDDLPKSKDKDCFILSSSLITDGEQCKAMVIGVGINSQWGKIKANLVTEPTSTPLQEKLEQMTRYVSILHRTHIEAASESLWLYFLSTDWIYWHGSRRGNVYCHGGVYLG
jgi:Ca2+-transporting ATPase